MAVLPSEILIHVPHIHLHHVRKSSTGLDELLTLLDVSEPFVELNYPSMFSNDHGVHLFESVLACVFLQILIHVRSNASSSESGVCGHASQFSLGVAHSLVSSGSNNVLSRNITGNGQGDVPVPHIGFEIFEIREPSSGKGMKVQMQRQVARVDEIHVSQQLRRLEQLLGRVVGDIKV
ncbi:YALIH222S03e03466g1_1 [Yarrowia lipolytica]|uniref:Uncharacterized protein n=1 Tax=Yarrowia lipolytica TaxID=4952 RepID=A0A1D8N9G4_YARLL|nr:hypothetical protein YALI1_C04351g [Yarrowia lipolytica]VBB84991.1 YALIH222S03e03466g1_1 [Yarrowia lipolytica]